MRFFSMPKRLASMPASFLVAAGTIVPARVKHVFLGHGHAAHFGRARFFQTTYGTKIGASARTGT